ncbi:hypothetical protein THAOC_35442 [Thalassiosira oceanica]|uniref:Phosphatidate cytidylyltransferase, mitochondrial n=1 Tax=Thalassiosira oceanica TaxID=159749 RepID=K0R3D1_THAOC|nr:hypothetical protein THAOC_35442 [Thalassiosira oceanica]|eukprot:EJK45919.1 hypothetical protein THAOC_35442 [Thalassiosira oceanica]
MSDTGDNCADAIGSAQLTSQDELSSIVGQFPTSGLDYAFGYGSGVLRQGPMLQRPNSEGSKRGMVDLIMAVDDAQSWHTANLSKNRHHYSSLAALGGPPFISWIQKGFGAMLYFHPFVSVSLQSGDGPTIHREIKYGIVSTNDLVQDLLDWRYLYLAGRMHKPETNHENTPTDSMPMSELFRTIASLSYTGDPRMTAGAEDPNKVTNLVKSAGMFRLWENKYAATFDKLQKVGILSIDRSVDGTRKLQFLLGDTGTRKQLVANLPVRLQDRADEIASTSTGSMFLRKEIANIVAPAARSQSMKGLLTAGPIKSWNYIAAKLLKGLLRRR